MHINIQISENARALESRLADMQQPVVQWIGAVIDAIASGDGCPVELTFDGAVTLTLAVTDVKEQKLCQKDTCG